MVDVGLRGRASQPRAKITDSFEIATHGSWQRLNFVDTVENMDCTWQFTVRFMDFGWAKYKTERQTF
jgi:hypothetical protein